MNTFDRREEMADGLAVCGVAVELALRALRRADKRGLEGALSLLMDAAAAVERLRD